MVAVCGTYENGYLTLDKELKINNPVRVVVTFLEDVETDSEKTLSFSDFSFAKSRKLTENLKSSVSDTLIVERRSEL